MSPRPPMSRFVLGIHRNSSARISSASIINMFGLFSALTPEARSDCVLGAGPSGLAILLSRGSPGASVLGAVLQPNRPTAPSHTTQAAARPFFTARHHMLDCRKIHP